METQINVAQPHVGIIPVVSSYGKTTHPKPHKKMIIEKYIPTIEAAQKVAEEALVIHVEKGASLKQYKGKRDPASTATRPISQPFIAQIPSESQQQPPKDVQIIDLSKSSTNHTPGSTKTVCSDGAIEMSTCHTENTDSDNQYAPWDTSKPDRQKHLVRSAIEQFERNVPCMSTLDRVMAWRVCAELDEVEEFSSDRTEYMEPFRNYLQQYDAVDRQTLSAQHYSSAVCNESSTLLRVDYAKKLNGNAAPNHRLSTKEPLFQLSHPATMLPIHTDDRAILLDTSIVIDSKIDVNDSKKVEDSLMKHIVNNRKSLLLEEAEDGCGDHSGSSESQKEELYKYLGIDTNPCHSRDAIAAKELTADEQEARCKRRSLRVKVQQIAINNLAKYHREKECIDRERRIDDNCPSKADQIEPISNQRKSLMAAKKLNGFASADKSLKHHRLLLPINITPKDRRLAATGTVNTSSTSATSSSQISGKFSDQNNAIFAQKKPVINVRGRGRPRKLIEPAANVEVDKAQLVDSSHRRSDSRKEEIATPLAKRRHSDQELDSDLYKVKIVSSTEDVHPTVAQNNAASNRSTSSASPYPQTTSSNELARPRSEKNFTSDERASNKSSPLIQNNFNQPSIPPPAKKVSLLERRNYSKSSAQLTPDPKSPIKSPTISCAANTYSTKVLMENRKLTETAAAAAVPTPPNNTFDPTSPPPPISERLQLRQLQRLAELENSPQESKFLRHVAKQKSPNSRRQVLKVISQRHKHNSKNMTKPTELEVSASDTHALSPGIAKHSNGESLPDNRLSTDEVEQASPTSQQQHIAITQLAEMGVSVRSVTAAPIRQRRPAVSPRIRRLTNLRISLRSHHRPSRSASMRRTALHANGTSSTRSLANKRNHRVLRPGNIFKRRKPVDEGFGESAAFSVAEENSDKSVDESPERAASSMGSVFLGFDVCNRQCRMSVDTIYESPEVDDTVPQLHEPIEPCLSTSTINDSTEPREQIPNIAFETLTLPVDELPVSQIIKSTSPTIKYAEPCDPHHLDIESIPIVFVESPEPCDAFHQLSTATSEKSSRSTLSHVSHKSSRFSVDSVIDETSDPKIINDLVSAAVAEIIGVVPVVVAAKPIVVINRIRSPCEPLINSNPLRASSGAVLAVVKPRADGNVVAVVQEREVSFWYQPSRVFDIFGVNQQWTCQAGIVRRTEDTEVQSPYQNRVLSHNGQLVYIECRAKQFDPSKTRECYLCAVYLNVYFVDQQTGEARMRIVDLDKILGHADSIRYTTISGANSSVVVSWTEMSAQRTRCGFCKYSLSMDLDMLEEVNEYPFAEQIVLSLSCFEDNKLLVLGENSVMLWDFKSGDMLLNLDIDQPLGVNLGGFIANERSNRFMFLIQLVPTDEQAQRLELLAINLSDSFSIKVVHSHDIPVDFADLSTSCVTSANVVTATFTSGHSLLMSLGNPRHIHLRQPNSVLWSPTSSSPELDHAPSSQSFMVHDQIVQVFKDRMSIRTIWDHFHCGA